MVEAIIPTVGSVWKKLSGVLAGKCGLSLKQHGKIYQSCVRVVLLYYSETWELTVTDELRLCRVEQGMIRAICGVKLVDSVSSDVLIERVGFVVKMRTFYYIAETPIH